MVVEWCGGSVVVVEWCGGSVVVVEWCGGRVLWWWSGVVMEWCLEAYVNKNMEE